MFKCLKCKQEITRIIYSVRCLELGEIDLPSGEVKIGEHGYDEDSYIYTCPKCYEHSKSKYSLIEEIVCPPTNGPLSPTS